MISMSTRPLTVKPHALLFQALANPSRMSILLLLREKGRMNVSEICEELGLEQTHVSHNMRCLSFCGLATVEREGKSRIYSINKETMFPLLEITENHIKNYGSNLLTCDVLER
jgi:ArsR family transcriptional regulator